MYIHIYTHIHTYKHQLALCNLAAMWRPLVAGAKLYKQYVISVHMWPMSLRRGAAGAALEPEVATIVRLLPYRYTNRARRATQPQNIRSLVPHHGQNLRLGTKHVIEPYEELFSKTR